MFSKYYQAELQYLRELGRDFGRAHPEAAGLLAERGGDPDVERLLEGFAFLTARIRERAEDAVPEIVVALADLLVPHYVRTLPACSILEFSPLPGALRGRQRIPRGVEVASVPVDGTSCRFRTTADVDLLPVKLTDVSLDKTSSATSTLRASFQLAQQNAAGAVFQPDGLRLYVHAEPAVASTLLLWFARHLSGVEVTGDLGGSPVPLGRDAVRFPGFAPENALLPWPKFGADGYRLLQEFMLMPAKFLFVDVVGLERAAHLAESRFELSFRFDRPPELAARPARDSLRLHCTPVVNLFATSADPVRRDLPVHEHLLRAAEMPPQHMEIYSVDEVIGIRPGRADRVRYVPFFDYSHSAEGKRDVAYYHVRRSPSVIDDGIDTYLEIVSPRDIPPRVEEETLSIEVTCTNRSLPTRLRAGDISTPTPLSPTAAKFRNITGVTRPVRPPFGSELHWRLLSHLALNHRSLGDPGTLRALLSIYNFVGEADEQLSRQNRLRVEAIQRVSVTPAKRLLEGAPVRGVRFTVEVDEKGFSSRGDAFLFGAVVDELLAHHVTVNSFTELVLELQPSQARYTWAPRSGRRSIV